MPTIAQINSIKVYMYFDDHAPPHFHAIYNEYEIQIEIKTLKTLHGSLPKKQYQSVIDWAEKSQDYLNFKWKEFNKQ
ncbi:hypothetical protein GGR28_000598 [Lewinella aquimaris]|uniref:DUF4160 domain-containing protein n=1 Tax=Neolewinella aquimaris TaxID=1835722 RepID=A0A840E4H1_9BACT|nr:DUF4160 domain-containing protein [Neolewinella aquimaris]MBB4077997.1 hypothetical protein [Neolewinella aquimaris]